MTLLSKKDHEMVIEALEALIEKKDEDNRFEYLNLLQWVKIKSKDSFWPIFQSSSAAELAAVNRSVAGSNPASGVGDTAKNQPLPCALKPPVTGGFYCINTLKKKTRSPGFR